jgi:hypothetical protein
MGELILCSHPIAAMPYYIDNISLNVYSLEELCYYIENHLYLIEADFMSEELCLWIGQELDEKDLAQSLRSVLLGNGSLSDFTELILRSCGYCSEDTIRHIRSVLLDMQNKSVFECSKIRADRYMESEKYVKNIVYEAEELFALYIKKLLLLASRLGNPGLPDCLVITVETLSRELTELFGKVAEDLGLGRSQLILQDRKESFYYFVYNQKQELWLHDIFLFDCHAG